MNARTFSNLGGVQSMLFCVGIYVAALFFSIFICSAVFKAVSTAKTAGVSQTEQVRTSGQSQVLASVR
ncbi:hypothetical protein KJS94_01065 [Flavihumibacter rivuli]|uniref:hypothetical protein n=1 Tax=Flavihumibacter rivuli TaxID=2838156 RepID=UPI001BDEC392|nr:hypothetical protein [Flavihumibacter rivuli]ULQ56785.1 hypothetical protein KJS94_01065 [Flavihumibacter rivuli]